MSIFEDVIFYAEPMALANAAWIKGKIERPYSFNREGFWRGYGFICLDTANCDLLTWISKKDERVHGTTHEVYNIGINRGYIVLS
jgi:hypothetical protein